MPVRVQFEPIHARHLSADHRKEIEWSLLPTDLVGCRDRRARSWFRTVVLLLGWLKCLPEGFCLPCPRLNCCATFQSQLYPIRRIV